MFNMGLLNRMAFDVRARDDGDIWLVLEMSEQMRQMAGSGENVVEMQFLQEHLGALVQGAAGVREEAHLEAKMGQEARASLLCYVNAEMRLTLEGESRLGSVTRIYANMEERTFGTAFFGRELPAVADMREEMCSQTDISCDILMEPVSGDVMLAAQVSTEQLSLEEAVYDVMIPPGGLLVIDSDAYTVMLDGENVMDRQQGAWLRLSPAVYDIWFEVERGRAADLDVQAVYKERWL